MKSTSQGRDFFSRMLALPEEDPERREFETEIWLLGGYWECRYYLSVLTETDQFVLSEEDYLDNLRSFVLSCTSTDASVFFDHGAQVEFFHSILRVAYEGRRGIPTPRRGRKRRLAVDMLLRHPRWSNAQIAEAVDTTEKQLLRNSDFTALRAVQRRKKTRR